MTSAPAWSQQFDPGALGAMPADLPAAITREWAWDGATGAGVKVAIVDSGVEGPLAGAVAVELADGVPQFIEGPHEDLFGHGTACAAIIRQTAPDAEIYSVRVLGASLKGTGGAFIAGIRWCLDNGMRVLNLSLSTRNRDHFAVLHELTDEAYFRGMVLVSAVNNVEAPSYPSQYASVLSVAARPGDDPFSFAYNPDPPVELGAPGIDIDVAWLGGARMKVTGNSFAAAHITGLATRILSKHPTLTPFQLKTVLSAIADNAG